MRVLVTGGTGVVGKPAVDRLLERGHNVRLLSRNATHDAEQWPGGVEPRDAVIGDHESLRGAADDCEVVLHIAGISVEEPPELTFQRVNVEGTQQLIDEAERAGVRRFVYVSSLGADRGESDYHRSKLAGEELTRKFSGSWLILRPGNVYGPGDEVISLLLKMVRALPIIPVISEGRHFQPIWSADLGQALAAAAESDLSGQVYPLAGEEILTVEALLDRFGEVTGKDPRPVPVPGLLAKLGAEAMSKLGFDLLPVSRDQIVMLEEGDVVHPAESNAITNVFGVRPTPLLDGLKILADCLPEQLPHEGVGQLHRQRYWADIFDSRSSAVDLLANFRRDFATLTPDRTLEVGTEPGSGSELHPGETVTLDIPVRGTMQVRVEEVTEEAVTLATVEGHHLAGMIRFECREHDGGRIRFEIISYTRASNWIDWLGRMAGGKPVQRSTWKSTVAAVIDRCGGQAPDGVHAEEDVCSDSERIERWAESLVIRRKREDSEGAVAR